MNKYKYVNDVAMVKTEYQNQLYLLLETGRKLSFGRLLTNNTLAMMRFVFILFIFVTSCHWLSAQDTLNYGKIREAHRLMELYNNYSGTKPIYAERCRDSAIYFLDQEIVSNRIISVSFPEGGLINMMLGTIELHDYDDVTLNFNFFRNSHTGTSPYASNNTVLEKLENIEPDKPFTCTFKIVPAKETYDVKTQRYINTPYFAAGFYIAIYVQILEIKLDSIKVKNIESDTTANINNRISTFKWGASSPTKDTLKQKSSIGNDPNTNGFGTYSPSGYSLNSRAVKSMPSPSNKENTEGKVVVIIQVDRDGNVVKAEAGAVGTTINNPDAWRKCEEAALKAKFGAKSDAPEIQKGTITYTFITLE